MPSTLHDRTLRDRTEFWWRQLKIRWRREQLGKFAKSVICKRKASRQASGLLTPRACRPPHPRSDSESQTPEKVWLIPKVYSTRAHNLHNLREAWLLENFEWKKRSARREVLQDDMREARLLEMVE